MVFAPAAIPPPPRVKAAYDLIQPKYLARRKEKRTCPVNVYTWYFLGEMILLITAYAMGDPNGGSNLTQTTICRVQHEGPVPPLKTRRPTSQHESTL